MDTFQIIFIVGISISALFLAITFIASVIYVVRSGDKVDKLSKSDKKYKYKRHWYNTLWIYVILCLDFFLLLCLYLAMYFGQGIYQNMGGLYVMWGRWFILLITGFLNAYCLTYVMTTTKHNDVQSFALVFTYALAYLFIIWATLSTDIENRALWIAVSGVSFIFSMLFYIFPHNKWRVVDGKYHKDILGEPWGEYYHRALYIILIVAYIIYFIVWILSKTNELTDVMSFETEAILYLVVDVSMPIIFAIYMILTTHRHMHHTLHGEKKNGDSSVPLVTEPRNTNPFKITSRVLIK